jgi:hypothetical protein
MEMNKVNELECHLRIQLLGFAERLPFLMNCQRLQHDMAYARMQPNASIAAITP